MPRGAPLILTLFLAHFFCGGDAEASAGVGAYLVPSFGYTWNRFFALEIEESFLGSESDGPVEPPGDDSPEVGSKAQYKGGGLAVGVSGGLRLFNMKLGLLYLYSAAEVEGAHKKYTYAPDLQRAVGEITNHSGELDIHRVLADIQYSVPFHRFELDFKTRIGAVLLRKSSLDTVNIQKGVSGNFGLGLSFFFLDFVAVGLEGYVGFYSFSQGVQGVYGIEGGIFGNVSLRI